MGNSDGYKAIHKEAILNGQLTAWKGDVEVTIKRVLFDNDAPVQFGFIILPEAGAWLLDPRESSSLILLRELIKVPEALCYWYDGNVLQNVMANQILECLEKY